MYYFIKYITTYVGEYHSVDNHSQAIIHLTAEELKWGIEVVFDKLGKGAATITSITPLLQ